MQRVYSFATVIVGALISSVLAFVNGFPLVYSDTGTYIRSGLSGFVPPDRPIFYGLFLKLVSQGSNLWLVVFAQALILSWLIFLTLRMYWSGKKLLLIFVSTMMVLTAFTGFSYYSSILLPDCFSAVAILCLLNLYLNSELNYIEKVTVLGLLLLSICVHLSNLPIVFLVVLILSLLSVNKRWIYRWKSNSLMVLVTLVIALVTIPTVHQSYTQKFSISQGGHVFMLNHLVEIGVINRYLDDNCDTKNLELCNYKGRLLPGEFIWNEHGALNKMGGWGETKGEFQSIIFDVYTTPKYWPTITWKAMEFTAMQFFQFDVYLDGPQLTGSPPYDQIQFHYPESLTGLENSLQNKGLLNFSPLNQIQFVFISLCLLIIIFSLTRRNSLAWMTDDLVAFAVIALIILVVSCLVCSNLSTVHPRYQGRIVWIIPLTAIIFAVKYVDSKLKKTTLKI